MGIRERILALTVLAAGFCSPSYAAFNLPAYEGDLKTQVEFRENLNDHDEIPFDNYLRLDIRDLPLNSTLHFYGKLWKDLGYGDDWRIDAYQLNLEVKLGSRTITLGRQFISEGFETHVADAVKCENRLKNGLRYTFYFGRPRDFEPISTNGEDLLWGAKLDYKGFFLAYENLRDDGNLKKSSFSAGFFRELNRYLSLYSRGEFDVKSGNFIEGEIGASVKPTKRLRADFEVSYYDPTFTFHDREYLDPIFELFSSGRQLRFKESVYYDLSDDWQFYQSYSYSDLQRSGNDDGHLFKAGFIRDTWLKNGWRFYGSFNYADSWLGTLRGIEAGFDKWLSAKLSFSGVANVARYDKVTYGKQWADSFFLSAKYSIDEFKTLEIGIEDRENEDFDRDTRLMFRFNYLFFGPRATKEEGR